MKKIDKKHDLSKVFPWIERPDTIQIIVGYRCNSKCAHCGVGDISHYQDMNIQLFKKALKESYKLGIRRFIISGGEPTLYEPHIKYLTHMLRDYPNVSVTILTNGWWGKCKSKYYENIIQPYLLNGGKFVFSLNVFLEKFVDTDTILCGIQKTLEHQDTVKVAGILGYTSEKQIEALITKFKPVKVTKETSPNLSKTIIKLTIPSKKTIILSFKGGLSPIGRAEKIVRNVKRIPIDKFPMECRPLYLTICPDGNIVPCQVSRCYRHLILGNINDNLSKTLSSSVLAYQNHTPYFYVREIIQRINPKLRIFNQCELCHITERLLYDNHMFINLKNKEDTNK